MNNFIQRYFGWLFSFFNGIYDILANKFILSFGGVTISAWHIIIAFTVLSVLISTLIHSGGGGSIDK